MARLTGPTNILNCGPCGLVQSTPMMVVHWARRRAVGHERYAHWEPTPRARHHEGDHDGDHARDNRVRVAVHGLNIVPKTSYSSPEGWIDERRT